MFDGGCCTNANFCYYLSHAQEDRGVQTLDRPKNTEAWKGRLKMFFVDPYTVEIAKNGTNII